MSKISKQERRMVKQLSDIVKKRPDLAGEGVIGDVFDFVKDAGKKVWNGVKYVIRKAKVIHEGIFDILASFGLTPAEGLLALGKMLEDTRFSKYKRYVDGAAVLVKLADDELASRREQGGSGKELKLKASSIFSGAKPKKVRVQSGEGFLSDLEKLSDKDKRKVRKLLNSRKSYDERVKKVRAFMVSRGLDGKTKGVDVKMTAEQIADSSSKLNQLIGNGCVEKNGRVRCKDPTRGQRGEGAKPAGEIQRAPTESASKVFAPNDAGAKGDKRGKHSGFAAIIHAPNSGGAARAMF